MSNEDKNRAKDQARAQLDSIVAMVNRLEHCQNCDGEDCELSSAEIYEGLSLSHSEGDEATDEEKEEYHDEDVVRQSISEDPLEISVRSGWHSPGEENEADEYLVLLCTGGPAVRITGSLGAYGEPEDAKLEYQDWFTPWERYCNTTSEEGEAKMEMPEDIKVESLTEQQTRKLNELKAWIYRQRVKHRKEKQRGERREQRQAKEEAKAEELNTSPAQSSFF